EKADESLLMPEPHLGALLVGFQRPSIFPRIPQARREIKCVAGAQELIALGFQCMPQNFGIMTILIGFYVARAFQTGRHMEYNGVSKTYLAGSRAPGHRPVRGVDEFM